MIEFGAVKKIAEKIAVDSAEKIAESINGELASSSVERVIKVGADNVAELGAVKPKGFGSLIRGYEHTRLNTERFYSTEFPYLDDDRGIITLDTDYAYLNLRYNDIALGCSETLCDYGIYPEVWKNADFDDRIRILKTAVDIFGRELSLPEDWIGSINPTAIEGCPFNAAAACHFERLQNGGVKLNEIPKLYVNADLTTDYFDAMSMIYHEMIHIKQYSAINSVAPADTTDLRLVDLISDLNKSDGGEYMSRVDYLHSPFEAEAWAQALCFKETLRAFVYERVRS